MLASPRIAYSALGKRARGRLTERFTLVGQPFLATRLRVRASGTIGQWPFMAYGFTAASVRFH
jgi:hypothetical protein